MVNERTPVKMLSEMGVRSMIGNGGEDELGFLIRDRRRLESIVDRGRERELDMFRSGSAPPTVEGSLNAIEGVRNGGNGVNGFLNEEELRSDPEYLSYYYSNVNRNPRLPPPVMSKEDWRFAQRLKVGGIGDRRKNVSNSISNGNNGSLFSKQPEFDTRKEEGEWLDRGGDGLIGLSLGRKKSFVDVLQEDLGRSSPILNHLSRPSSRNAFDDGIDEIGSVNGHSNNTTVGDIQSNGISSSQTFASVLGSSLSRSNAPDPNMARSPSPCLPPVGARLSNTDKKNNNNGYSSFTRTLSGLVESDDLAGALSAMNLSTVGPLDEDIIAQSQLQKEMEEHQNFLFGVQGGYSRNSYPDLARNSGTLGQTGHQRSNLSPFNSHVKPASASFVGSPGGSPAHYQDINSVNASFTSYGLSGYPIDPTSPSMVANHICMGNFLPGSPGVDSMALGGLLSSGQNLTGVDPLYVEYLRSAEYFASNNLGNSYLDLLATQKQNLGTLFQPQKQYGMPFLGKSASLNHGYYGNPGLGGMTYAGSPMASPILPARPILPASPGGPGSPLRIGGERTMHFSSSIRNFAGGNMNDSFAASLLEEFKSNKTKSYDLSDIVGHVVEFSADQYGSRFIQLKLETATTEQKNMIYDELMIHAFSLMTDVFGNYVIQKFFEHGSPAQRRELADKLTGHVLTLSLQMYGCRVIQKAIEVVDLDQQTKMVAELDGHVMRCVRDQNGNHVIQKCIECIPQDAIHFIISTFYDQVINLSTHPYGCRVIQRVLEHCDNPSTQQIMMDEILQNVCMLAQDQYGNYVIQHVLEHGKPNERSAIITKLAGQIVQMSQQKFASNVVEKCLAFGGPAQRQILVNEMLGTTDENEPLQAMMKDQFANYVVQKVLETCDNQQRELILSRIKVHLNALKKYTYGKHIVARVEKLVVAGERRIGVQSSCTS